MRRRLVIALLSAGAVLFAVLSLLGLSPAGANATSPPEVKAPVISPERVPALLGAVASDANLRSSLNAATPGKLNGQTCVAANRAGRAVADINDGQALVPASTEKLLTATAALSIYGPNAKFNTAVESAAAAQSGVISGPIYLVGGGDPLLFTADYAKALNTKPDVHTSIEALADDVVKAGVKVVHGGVVGDDSRFDKVRYSPSWEPSYQLQGQIGATGALQMNQGFGRFVGGRIAAPDPTLQTATEFTLLLKARGVQVDGAPAVGNAPTKSSAITSIDSARISDIVGEMLTNSDNSTAEMLFRDVGVKASGTGSFAAGAAAVSTAAARAHIPLNGAVVADGSGLDRSDRVTCATLVAALVSNGPNGPIAQGLPKAGQTGTLADRMKASPAVGRVEAKTGTLPDVSALAGWATPPGGAPIAFAIVNNGATSESGRGFEDSLAETLAALPTSPD